VHGLLHVNCETTSLRGEELQQLHCGFPSLDRGVMQPVHDCQGRLLLSPQ